MGESSYLDKNHAYIYNYVVIIGCQLEWAYPILTGLFGDILFFIVPDIGGEMFVLIYFWSIMHLVGH